MQNKIDKTQEAVMSYLILKKSSGTIVIYLSAISEEVRVSSLMSSHTTKKLSTHNQYSPKLN